MAAFKVLLDKFYTDCGYQHALGQKISNAGFDVIESDYIRYHNENFGKLSYLKDDELLVYGSIQFVQDAIAYFPKAMCFYNNIDYNVSSYMSKIDSRHFINSDVQFIPFGMFMMQQERFLSEYDHKMFIRSDNGNKSFSGNVITADNIDAAFSFSGLSERSFLAVSRCVDISEEYRFIIVNDKVVSGCQYHKNGELCLNDVYPNGAFEKAKEIASLPSQQLPDSVFVCDIGRVGNDYMVVEFNAFSTADLYLNDATVVFQEIKKVLEYESSCL